jgi:DNA repair ATPase RecN
MLEKIKIENFQAHEKLLVDVDPHVTTIVGRTDAGKSSIIRALRWVACNRPTGDSVRKWGTERTSVAVLVDGHTIRKIKKKGVALYKLDDKTYKAFKTDVPPEIEKVLNFHDVNIQQQHDAPFWFFETPGQVGKELNAIVNLELIDQLMVGIDKLVRTQKVVYDTHSKRAIESAKKVKQTEQVPDMAEAADDVVEAHRYLVDTQSKVDRLDPLVIDVVTYIDVRDAFKRRAQVTARLTACAVTANNATQRATSLASLINSAQHAYNKTNATQPNLGPMLKALKAAQAATNQYKALCKALKSIKGLRETIEQAEQEAQKTKEEIKKQTKGSICPTCSRPL